MGVPYVAVLDSVRGIVLRKAARRRSTLNTGDTKTVNGITYTFNENRRWTRADKKSRSKPRSPKAAAPAMNMTIPVIDQPKVKGKPKAIAPMASKAKLPIEATAKQARRTAPRAMSVQGMPELKPKGKPAQIKPKGKTKPQAERKPKRERKLKQKEATTSSAGYLQATNWNPHAIPDLTPIAFGQYLTIKANIVAQENPESQHNQTKEQTGLNTSQYRSAIDDAIRNGFIPSDAAIAEAKLNKTQLKKIELNRKLQEQWRQQTEQIEKALNHTMSDEKADRDWSPQMTEEEAKAYTSDSFFGATSWYHGNSQEVTNSIATEGAQPERNRRGMYGQGVYFGVDRSIGESYAAASGLLVDAELITAQIRTKNPCITTREEINKIREYLAEFSYTDEREQGAVALNQYLRVKGYDSIYLQDVGYGIAFDTKQVITTARQNISESQKEQIGADMKLNAEQTVAAIRNNTQHIHPWQRNSNAQAMASLKLTQLGELS